MNKPYHSSARTLKGGENLMLLLSPKHNFITEHNFDNNNQLFATLDWWQVDSDEMKISIAIMTLLSIWYYDWSRIHSSYKNKKKTNKFKFEWITLYLRWKVALRLPSIGQLSLLTIVALTEVFLRLCLLLTHMRKICMICVSLVRAMLSYNIRIKTCST